MSSPRSAIKFTFTDESAITPSVSELNLSSPAQAESDMDKKRIRVSNKLPENHPIFPFYTDSAGTEKGWPVGTHSFTNTIRELTTEQQIISSLGADLPPTTIPAFIYTKTTKDASEDAPGKDSGQVFMELKPGESSDYFITTERSYFSSFAFNYDIIEAEHWHLLYPPEKHGLSLQFNNHVYNNFGNISARPTSLLKQTKQFFGSFVLEQEEQRQEAEDEQERRSKKDSYALQGMFLAIETDSPKQKKKKNPANWRQFKSEILSNKSLQPIQAAFGKLNKLFLSERKIENSHLTLGAQLLANFFRPALDNIQFFSPTPINPEPSPIDTLYSYRVYLYKATKELELFSAEIQNAEQEKRLFDPDKAGLLATPAGIENLIKDLNALLQLSSTEVDTPNLIKKPRTERQQSQESESEESKLRLVDLSGITLTEEKTLAPDKDNISKLKNSLKVLIKIFCAKCGECYVSLTDSQPRTQSMAIDPELLIYLPSIAQEIDASYFFYRFFLAYITQELTSCINGDQNSIFNQTNNQAGLLIDLENFLSKPDDEINQSIISIENKQTWLHEVKQMQANLSSFNPPLIINIATALDADFTMSHQAFMQQCEHELSKSVNQFLLNRIKHKLREIRWEDALSTYISELEKQTESDGTITSAQQTSIQRINTFITRYKDFIYSENNKTDADTGLKAFLTFISSAKQQARDSCNPTTFQKALKLLPNNSKSEESIDIQLFANLEILKAVLKTIQPFEANYLDPSVTSMGIIEHINPIFSNIESQLYEIEADVKYRLSFITELLSAKNNIQHVNDKTRSSYITHIALSALNRIATDLNRQTQENNSGRQADHTINQLFNELEESSEFLIEDIPRIISLLRNNQHKTPSYIQEKLLNAFASLYAKKINLTAITTFTHGNEVINTERLFAHVINSYHLANAAGDAHDCFNLITSANLTNANTELTRQNSTKIMKTLGYYCIAHQLLYAFPSIRLQTSPMFISTAFELYCGTEPESFSIINSLLAPEQAEQVRAIANDIKTAFNSFKDNHQTPGAKREINGTFKKVKSQLDLLKTNYENTSMYFTIQILAYLNLLACHSFIADNPLVGTTAHGIIEEIRTGLNSALASLIALYQETDPELTKAYQDINVILNQYVETIVFMPAEIKTAQEAIKQELSPHTSYQHDTENAIAGNELTSTNNAFVHWAKQLFQLSLEQDNPVTSIFVMTSLNATLSPLYDQESQIQLNRSDNNELPDLIIILIKLCFEHSPPLVKEGCDLLTTLGSFYSIYDLRFYDALRSFSAIGHQPAKTILQQSRTSGIKQADSRLSSRKITFLQSCIYRHNAREEFSKTLGEALTYLETSNQGIAIEFLVKTQRYAIMQGDEEINKIIAFDFKKAFEDTSKAFEAISKIPLTSEANVTQALKDATDTLAFFLILMEMLCSSVPEHQVAFDPNTNQQALLTQALEGCLVSIHSLTAKAEGDTKEGGIFFKYVESKKKPSANIIKTGYQYQTKAAEQAAIFNHNIALICTHIGSCIEIQRNPGYLYTAGRELPENIGIYEFNSATLITMLYQFFTDLKSTAAQNLLQEKIFTLYNVDINQYTAEMLDVLIRTNIEGVMSRNSKTKTKAYQENLRNKAPLSSRSNSPIATRLSFSEEDLAVEEPVTYGESILYSEYATILLYEEAKQVFIHIKPGGPLAEKEVNSQQIFHWLFSSLVTFARNLPDTEKQPVYQITAAVQSPQTGTIELVSFTHNTATKTLSANYADFMTTAIRLNEIYGETSTKGLTKKAGAAEELYELFNRQYIDMATAHINTADPFIRDSYEALLKTMKTHLTSELFTPEKAHLRKPGDVLVICLMYSCATKLANEQAKTKIKPFNQVSTDAKKSGLVTVSPLAFLEANQETVRNFSFLYYIGFSAFNQSIRDKSYEQMRDLETFQQDLINQLNKPSLSLRDVYSFTEKYSTANCLDITVKNAIQKVHDTIKDEPGIKASNATGKRVSSRNRGAQAALQAKNNTEKTLGFVYSGNGNSRELIFAQGLAAFFSTRLASSSTADEKKRSESGSSTSSWPRSSFSSILPGGSTNS